MFALRLANRFVALPTQTFPHLEGVSQTTIVALLLMAAPAAGIIEESAFGAICKVPSNVALACCLPS